MTEEDKKLLLKYNLWGQGGDIEGVSNELLYAEADILKSLRSAEERNQILFKKIRVKVEKIKEEINGGK